MARQNAFSIKLDSSRLDASIKNLASLDPEAFGKAIVATLNQVADETYVLSRQKMIAGINLTGDYVKRRMEVEHATAKTPTASIIAPTRDKSGKPLETNISHYGAVRFTQSVKHPSRSKGDTGRGYSKGQKAAGAAAEVTRGSSTSIGKKFAIVKDGALLKDSEGNAVLFQGTGRPGKGSAKGKPRKTPRQGVKAVLGPSVYQLFRFTAENIYKQVGEDLEEAIVATAQREFEKVLK